MAISVNIDGVTREVIKPSVCIGGVWRDVISVKNNVDGVWRESFNTNVYTINMYRYGELWKRVNVLEGESVTLDECDTLYDDDTFYGWSKSASSTSISYTSGSTVIPTTDLNLYAVFSYKTVSTSSTVQAPNTTVTYTITADGTANLTAKKQTSYSGPSAGSMTGGMTTIDWNSRTTAPYYTHNGTVKISTSLTVKTGDAIMVTTPAVVTDSSNYYGSGGYIMTTVTTVNITLPTYTTAYRVASHG